MTGGANGGEKRFAVLETRLLFGRERGHCGNGGEAWFGWPTMPAMEALRDAWFDAPDLAAQQKICRDMQALAFEEVPVLPSGMFFSPTAYRANLTGVVKSGVALMWGIKRA